MRLPALLFLALPALAAEPVTLNWLGTAAPAATDGVSWGVPWPKAAVRPDTPMQLATADGRRIEVQTWPLAFWPDGSIKWSGHAIAATAGLAGPFALAPRPGTKAGSGSATAIKYTDDATALSIDTGIVRATIPKHGPDLVATFVVGDRTVAQHGRLVAQLEDRSRLATEHVLREEEFTSAVDSVTLEQAGPIRAVVKITGQHQSLTGNRTWLPFVVRLQFFAGSGAIKLTHSLVFDGDGTKDFIKGLGLSFEVPFQEELHNRHVRFVGGAGGGVWAQPVRMLPGYRPQAGRTIADDYAEHLAGQRVPNLSQLDERTRAAILTVPVWADAKLTQLGPNGWSIYKRTSADASWLHVADGQRARGLAVLADVSGGLAVGVKDFWQKAPASFEITGGASAVGTLTIWLWSPDADAMDLRRYDETPHGLGINYEDWKPGWGAAFGVANTHDLTLWAFAAIPSDAQLLAMADAAAAPPVLVCTPEYYHAQHAFGWWSLPDRSTPAAQWVEDQVQGLVDFYEHEVGERSWFGFWDFGDIMHNYDFGRHDWRYDVGGWAWANTELMPDMLLWFSFLRTGRADLFRMAEAMTRHTSEVDVHHLGPFAPLGSRHNVNHWGDGAKQPRVSHDGLKQFYYFLSGGDGRIGDLMREQLDADLTYTKLQQFNGSHYVPGPDGQPQLDARASGPAPTPDQLAAVKTDRAVTRRLGLEWMCYAMNWTMEWQRTGDTKWRDRVASDMRAMGASLDANGRLPGGYFDMIFGGPENLFELEPMFADIPDFWRGWANTCEGVGRSVNGGQMTGPRMLAYAAHAKNSDELGRLAWDKLIGTSLAPAPQPKAFSGPNVVQPVTDPAFLGDPVGWQLHGVGSIQWALNAIETLELAKPWLPAWEKAHAAK